MFDFSFGELAVIGAVALVVLGPERLPKVARTVGEWAGKAQRYVSQVKADINREMEVAELKKLQEQARGIDQVAFSQSSDNGATWSRPIRIDRTPPNANILRQQAFVPSIEVGPDGELVVTYYNFQNDTAETPEATDYWSVFCSSDCTRRASWGSLLRLTNRSFDMLDAPIAVGHFLGDYMGLVTAGAVAHPVFGIATGTDRTTEFTRRIEFD